MSVPEYTPPQEELPNYQPSLQYYGLCLTKTEFLTPYHANPRRSWKPVILELNSTQLNFYDLNCSSHLKNLIISLYGEQNQLDDLAINLNNDYQQRKSASDIVIEQLDDLFAGDAYGGLNLGEISEELAHFKTSASDKVMKKWGNYKTNKSFKHLSSYYKEMKNNLMLMEPTSNYEEYRYSQLYKYRSDLINSYTLDNLKVGEAPSLNQLISALYKEDTKSTNQPISTLTKYKNCLRLRIECKQMLLQFWSFHSLINWFRNLSIGKDLCKPVDQRLITKLKSIPNRSNLRNNALLIASAAAAAISPNTHSTRTSISTNVSTSSKNSSELIFSNTPRRESLASIDSYLEEVNIQGYNFVSNDNLYTPIEKQFISNCIPDLNSFDKWSGADITLSNYQHYLKKDNLKDIFINYTQLYDLVIEFDKKFIKQKINGDSRSFLIHENGLVSVK